MHDEYGEHDAYEQERQRINRASMPTSDYCTLCRKDGYPRCFFPERPCPNAAETAPIAYAYRTAERWKQG